MLLGRWATESDFHPSSHSKYAKYGHESDEYLSEALSQIFEIDGDPLDLIDKQSPLGFRPLGFRLKSPFPFQVPQEVAEKYQAPDLDTLLSSYGQVVDYSPYFTGQFKEDVLEQYGLDKATIDTMNPLCLTQDGDDQLFDFESDETWFDPELPGQKESISAAEAYVMTAAKNKEINNLLTNSDSRRWYLDNLRKLQEMAISGVQNQKEREMVSNCGLVSFPATARATKEVRRASLGEVKRNPKKKSVARRPSSQHCNFDNFGD